MPKNKSDIIWASGQLLTEPFSDDYEPTDEEMLSSFGTKWHDWL